MRKKPKPTVDPELTAAVAAAAAAARRREEFLSHVGTGRIDGNIGRPSVFSKPTGDGGIPASPLHAHDDGCWDEDPWRKRANNTSVEVGRVCRRFGYWVPDHYASDTEAKELRAL